MSPLLFEQLFLLPETPRIPPLLGESFAQDFGKWIHEHRPEVIVFIQDRLYDQVTAGGFQSPRDAAASAVKVASADQRLAGMRFHHEETCRIAIELLHDEIRLGQKGIPHFPRDILVPSLWLAGETLPPWNGAN